MKLKFNSTRHLILGSKVGESASVAMILLESAVGEPETQHIFYLLTSHLDGAEREAST